MAIAWFLITIRRFLIPVAWFLMPIGVVVIFLRRFLDTFDYLC